MEPRHRVLAALGALLLVGFAPPPTPVHADDCAPAFIDTVAGGGICDGILATDSVLAYPAGVAVGCDGDLYIADTWHCRVRKIDAAGIIMTVAGGGNPADGLGDGGPATDARLDPPGDIAFSSDGSLYIAVATRVRKVSPSGIIITAAGDGESGFSGDGGPAIEASLAGVTGVSVGPDDSLYLADAGNHRIRKVDAAGIVTTVAGNGEVGDSGDGGPATEASLSFLFGLEVGPDGSVYVVTQGRVRKVDPSGTISTVVTLYGPTGVTLGMDGTPYVASAGLGRIYRLSPNGDLSALAGNGSRAYCGDGGPATAACLDYPEDVALAPDGSLYIADRDNHRIRKVDPAGIISTVAGNGSPSSCGDDGPARESGLTLPLGVGAGPEGSIYVADAYSDRIREVGPDGIITTVAGGGRWPANLGDGGPAVEAILYEPNDVAAGPDGSFYIADTETGRIRKVDPDGIITTVAGGGQPPDWLGDGGPATEAWLEPPRGVAVGADGNLCIADTGHNRIRKVNPAGIITTVAGTGRWWDPLGDGGPAIEASLNRPTGVAVDSDGSIYIADTNNHRVRKVGVDGVIITVAGDGWTECGPPDWEPPCGGRYQGDGGLATEASLNYPADVAVGPDGTIYIADTRNHRIRKVDHAGMITTIAGIGDQGFAGDGGAATEARLDSPQGVAVAPDGSVYIADSMNHRIRRVWQGPCCAVQHEPAVVAVGDVVALHSNAYSPHGLPLTCEWDFGDGSTGLGCDAAHVFAWAGSYQVCATVTDDRGASHNCCVPVIVSCDCDVGLVAPWCHLPSGQVGQTKQGRIAARNTTGQTCTVTLRVTNGAGTVVFEEMRTLQPLRSVRAEFSHTFTTEDIGRAPWTWEVWPVECSERTPPDNVFSRRVTVTNLPR